MSEEKLRSFFAKVYLNRLHELNISTNYRFFATTVISSVVVSNPSLTVRRRT